MTHQLISLVGNLLAAAIVFMVYHESRFDRSLKYRTFWPRFWSGTVDACVLWPLNVIAFLAAMIPLSPLAITAMIVVQQSVSWAYVVVMHARFGQTVGKMVTGVRVLDSATEQPIGFSQALLRESIPIVVMLFALFQEIHLAFTNKAVALQLLQGQKVSVRQFPFSGVAIALPGFWFLAEVITMLSNDKRRALHDFIAGTVVVRTSLVSQGAPTESAPIPAT